jgi:hypothetical protein
MSVLIPPESPGQQEASAARADSQRQIGACVATSAAASAIAAIAVCALPALRILRRVTVIVTARLP